MKNPFRDISPGGRMIFALTMLTFGAYALTSVFLLFWIPGVIPMGSIFFLPPVLLILFLWYCIRSIRFYNRLNRELFTDWLMPHYAFNTFLILLISGFFFVVFRIRNFDFPEYWGQLFITVLIAYFFGILPLPAAFKKSRKAGIYVLLSLFCAWIGFLFLSLACKMMLHGFFSLYRVIEKLSADPMETDFRWFSLFGQKVPLAFLHLEWLIGISLALLLAACFFYAKMLSELTGEPLRKIFPKPVFYLVGATAACHILFLLLCWSAASQLESARLQIQKRFGRYPNAEELSKLYFSGMKSDKNFWFSLEKALENPNEDRFRTPKASDIPYDFFPDRFILLTDQEKRMFDIELSKKSSALAEMLLFMNAGIPKYPFNIKKGEIMICNFHNHMIMRLFSRHTSWKSCIALEGGNKSEAFRFAELTRKMAQYGENHPFLIGALSNIKSYNHYFDSLERLTEKHFLTREQIQMISGELLAMEMRLPRMEKDTLFSDAVGASEDLTELILNPPEEYGQGYSIRRMPLFLPQLYWLLLLNQTSLVKAYDVDDFGKIPSSRNIPLKPSLMAKRMFTGSSESVHIKFMNLLARSRAERVILACELFRMDTGKYPTAASELVPKYLDSIPEDPFTGKLLLFRAGKIRVEVWKIAEKDKIVRVVGEPKEIEGIQVWSVGPNGKDDDGIYNNQKNQDDIRAVIQTR
ncbi:MAG: hypothetical protein BWY31_00282 [Lentisphaerae bacterium ADurb.Bin242]|nr:MAG: hypothetical protein BWY31_00282 [Lentisphaerae bacterium ADurb.Bin242]